MIRLKGNTMAPHVKPAQGCALVATLAASLTFSSCAAAHGPVLDRGEKPPVITGTIAGLVRAAGSNMPLAARKVTAVEVTTGAKYEASTGTNGGYTLKVPIGKYRLEVELRAGESVVKAPAELEITASDLDAGRDFTIGVQPTR